MDNLFYVLKIHDVLAFDTVARKTQFSGFNERFNGYRSIIGGTPVYLKDKTPVPENIIYRTDIFFGDGIKKSPILIVGVETKKILEEPFSRQICFQEILSSYPPNENRVLTKRTNWFSKLLGMFDYVFSVGDD